jgi:uncharacterized repeat protein (TIGR01451 family)
MKWVAAAILLLVAALVFRLGLLAYAMYALLGVMLLSKWLSRTWAENLSAQRECNRVAVNVGEKVAVMVTLQNRGLLPVAWALVEDLLPRGTTFLDPPSLSLLGNRLQLCSFLPRGRARLFYQLQCNRRGYHQIGPLMLETGDLFGLDRRYRMLTAPHFLLVYPEIAPLEGYDLASRMPLGEIRMSHRLFEDPTRIAGVRGYEAGDPLNRVHWRATARAGTLQCKVYEASTVAGATLLLDFHQADYESRHEPFRSELAVMATASIAHAVYEMGQQIGLVTNGRDAADRIRQEGFHGELRSRTAARKAAEMSARSDRLQPVVVPTRRGPEQLLRILEALARVELTDGLGFPQLIAETACRLPRDATVIAVVSALSPDIAAALGDLRRRGMAVTVVLNLYDEDDFVEAAARLLAQGIAACHLRDRESIVTVCREYRIGHGHTV